MSAIISQIHIDTSSSTQPLPVSPIPLPTSTSLTPSTQLRIPIATGHEAKPHQLAQLADAIDTTRAELNKILTAWKDWAGKEDAPSSNTATAKHGDQEEEQEDEDDEEE